MEIISISPWLHSAGNSSLRSIGQHHISTTEATWNNKGHASMTDRVTLLHTMNNMVIGTRITNINPMQLAKILHLKINLIEE